MDDRSEKEEPELMVLSGDEEDDEEEEEEEEERDEDDVDLVPVSSPGVDATHPIESTLLAPFFEGWRRECVTRSGSDECDVYYIPPESDARSREAHRKKRSKRDIIRYFDEFPSSTLSVINFTYVNRPLGLNNAAYEIVRTPYAGLRAQTKGPMNYSDSKAAARDEEDDEEEILEEYSTETPIVLQTLRSIIGMKAQHKKRRKRRTAERCQTPFMAHEAKWTNLDDDPMGIFTALGGESDPPTPPPLRALKLTPRETAEKIAEALAKVKEEASQLTLEKEVGLKDNLASHDTAIMKYKNHLVERKYSGFNYINPQQSRLKKTSLEAHLLKKSLPCTLHCPGADGLLPNLTCVSCQCLFHAHCQGVSQTSGVLKTFKCRSCSTASQRIPPHPVASSSSSSIPLRPFTSGQINSIIKVKLPMATPNGRRPIVELVMHQHGRYQPIKFSNNMQVTEMISQTLFERATTLQRTLYQKATRVPRVGGRPIFLAINPTTPSNRGQLNALLCSAQLIRPSLPVSSPHNTPPSQIKGDQVSILVRSQSSAKPVLLNVPRKIAIKVKVGTTLSFSASSDQKYTVIDNKIHPPVSSSKRTTTSTTSAPTPKRPTPDLTVYKGITISRITDKRQTSLPPMKRAPPPEPSFKVTSDLDMSPCTPYCPGVTGFPEVECKGCQSLFHAQCVGLLNSRVMTNFLCKMCSRSRTSNSKKPPQVIDLD